MSILGIDEVGRGPWAGPLVIGAVILGDEKLSWHAELTDSKKLSAKKREALAEKINSSALAHALGWVSASEIDKIGLGAALRLATRRATKQIQSQKIPFHEIIIDGNINFLAGTPLSSRVTILKKADLLVKEVSAASIIAKVARDHYMVEAAKKYPGYGFEKHVGYGTVAHRQSLPVLGPCPEHRLSFRPVAAITKTPIGAPSGMSSRVHPDSSSSTALSTTVIGSKAEARVATLLQSRGHQILARNYKTKRYEIDIISVEANKIYFTEVKYRKNSSHGDPLEMVNTTKLQQMRFAAQSFLQSRGSDFISFSPVLAVAAVSGPNFTIGNIFELTD